MTTFDGLANAVLANLQGFSVDQDQITYLTAGIDADDTTLSVADPREVSRGLVEIDDELLWARAVDLQSASVSLAPMGRGWMGTTAATHAQNATVKNNPQWPKVSVKRALNDTIRACYPDLYKVKSTSFSFSPTVNVYELPAETDDVYDVAWQSLGATMEWPRLHRWRYMPNAPTSAFPSGKALQLFQSALAGQTVQVTYLVAPTPLSAGNDDFSAVSGLPASAEDVVIYGACYRLAGYLDIPRLQAQTIEGSNRANLTPPGSATNASKYFYALYMERLQQEREILLGRYPRVTHSVRR